jgi:hypothetical protein
MGIALDEMHRLRQAVRDMPQLDETHRLSWPWWAPWALIAVVLTCALTVAATLYDIL